MLTPMQTRFGWCDNCGRASFVEKRAGNNFAVGLVHFVLTILTAGVWLLVLLAIRVRDARRPWICFRCGSEASTRLGDGADRGMLLPDDIPGCPSCGGPQIRGDGECRNCRGTGQTGFGSDVSAFSRACDVCFGSGTCQACRGGVGVLFPGDYRAAGGATPPIPFGPALAALTGYARIAFVLATGFVVLMIVMIPLGWWSSASDAIRSVLEALPLGDAVAEKPSQNGDPILVAVLAAAAVAGSVFAATRWRLTSVREYLFGGNTFVQPFVVSVIRTMTIFGGITLVPIVYVVAAGDDLREEPGYTFTGPLWPILIVLCWLAYSWYGMGRVHDREAGRPPRNT